jgi:hypothetical protein
MIESGSDKLWDRKQEDLSWVYAHRMKQEEQSQQRNKVQILHKGPNARSYPVAQSKRKFAETQIESWIPSEVVTLQYGVVKNLLCGRRWLSIIPPWRTIDGNVSKIYY